MSYPEDIDVLPDMVDKDFSTGEIGTPINAEFFNPRRDSIISIQTVLGVNPEGDSATVAERLSAQQINLNLMSLLWGN